MVDLRAHEAAGGHTLARHVDRTAPELNERLASSGLSRASSFTDVATATAAVTALLDARADEIERWLGGSQRRRVLVAEVGFETGQVSLAGQEGLRASRGARAVLERRTDLQHGYLIVTAYPT